MSVVASQQSANQESLAPYIRTTISLLALSYLYFYFHPAFYGDAVRYASDIREGALLHDAGHFYWRPLGSLLWHFLSLFLSVDPLVAFQLLSSFCSAILILSVYGLSRRLGLPNANALASSMILASTNLLLAYAGSGSAYCAAMGLSIASIYFLIPNKSETPPIKKSNAHWIFAGACFLLAWGCWAVTVLLFPVLFYFAFSFSEGKVAARFFKATLFLVILGTLMVLSTGIGFFVNYAGPHNLSGLVSWLNTSTHGIPLRLSGMSVCRALIGFFSSFLHLGELGFSLKALLLRDYAVVDYPQLILYLSLLTVLALFFLKASLRVFRILGPSHSFLQFSFPDHLFVPFLLANVPAFLFAITWQGSDIERLGVALPFNCILLGAILGVSSQDGSASHFRSAHWLALFLYTANLSTLVVPQYFQHGGLPLRFGREMAKHASTGDLLVISGQKLGPRVWSTAQYQYGFRIHSILFDVQNHPSELWASHLDEAINKQIIEGRSIIVLSDFVDQDTPGGIGLSTKEYPIPRIDDIREYFSDWVITRKWKVDNFLFYHMVPATMKNEHNGGKHSHE